MNKIYLIFCAWILTIMFVITLSGCATRPKFDSFKAQSCIKVYCDNSEDSVKKAAALKLTEIAASIYNVDLDLNRGFCEEYYTKRDIDYRYLRVGAEEVCNQ